MSSPKSDGHSTLKKQIKANASAVSNDGPDLTNDDQDVANDDQDVANDSPTVVIHRRVIKGNV